MSNLITGLDIGSSQIKGVVVEARSGGVLLLVTAFKRPSAGLRKGVVTDVEEFSQTLREVVLDLQKISKKATRNIFVNVNSEHIKARTSRGIAAVARSDQEIREDDIDRALQASRAVRLPSNYLVLHNIIREYLVDDIGDIADPEGMTGSRLEVSTLMIEAFTPQVNLLVKSLHRVGAETGGLIFNPLAAAQAVLSKKQKDLGVLMIDFGFGTTSFSVFEENKVLYAKSIPIGSGYLTNDIAIGLKTSIDAAENLKLNYGFALAKEVSRREMVKLEEFDPSIKGEASKRFLAEIIEVRLAEVLSLIHNDLKALGKNNQLPAGVVMTGGGVNLRGVVELVKQELKLPVQIGLPNLSRFEIINPAHEELLNDPVFSLSVGLVLWGNLEAAKPKTGFQVIKSFFRNFIP